MTDVTAEEAVQAYNDARLLNPLQAFEFDAHNSRIFNDVAVERYRQNVKFTGDVLGAQHHNIVMWAGILAEETGETMQESLDATFSNLSGNEVSLAKTRAEAVQAAAVAFAVIKAIDDKDPALLAAEVTQIVCSVKKPDSNIMSDSSAT